MMSIWSYKPPSCTETHEDSKPVDAMRIRLISNIDTDQNNVIRIKALNFFLNLPKHRLHLMFRLGNYIGQNPIYKKLYHTLIEKANLVFLELFEPEAQEGRGLHTDHSDLRRSCYVAEVRRMGVFFFFFSIFFCFFLFSSHVWLFPPHWQQYHLKYFLRQL